VLLIAAMLSAAAPAAGQGGDQASAAQVLFDEALALMASGKYVDACPKLETSQKLDPGMGTQFRLAECYEHVGKLASAWAIFVEVAEAAKQGGNADREDVSRKRAEALRPRLPMLTVHVSPAAASSPGLEIERDGLIVAKPLWDRAVPVDVGPHRLVARATGKQPWEHGVNAVEASVVEATVPALADLAAPPPVTTATPDAPPSGGGGMPTQRWLAIAAGVIGVGGVAFGTIFGLKASSTWDDAIGGCEGRDPTKCTPEVQSRGDDALGQAHLSTVGFAVGGAGLVAAGVLWFTAPSAAASSPKGLRVTPFLDTAGGGWTAAGRF
jgi:hypothetical protein